MSKPKFLPPLRISCGHQFTLAVTDIGELFAWGDNKNAKLALDIGPEIVWRPTKVPIKDYVGPVHEVASGSEFSLCIVVDDSSKESGTLLAWGVSNYGQAGEEAEVRTPSPLSLSLSSGDKPARVACGNDFAACISENGRLFTWGRGNYGNLGHGNTDHLSRPTLVSTLADQVVLDVACGAKHTLAVTNTFKVYSWGSGAHGRLGHGDTSGSSSPRLIQSLSNENIMSVSAGDSHSSSVSTLGSVFTWGCGSHGRLGQGSDSNYYIPTEVSSLKGKRMYMSACGFRHTLSLSIHGEVFAWGGSNYGVLGLFDLKETRNMLIPLKVQHLDGKKVNQIACGTWHSVAITSAGEIWTWGYHGHGRLGLGSETRVDQPFPKQISSSFIYGITGGMRIVERIAQVTGSKKLAPVAGDPWKIVQVEAGSQFSVALTKAGTLWVWGEGQHGALGTGSVEDQPVPIICGGLNNVTIQEVACGGQHVLAISSSEVFSWGSGKFGQLGCGIISSCPVPKSITLLQGKNIVSGSCGEDYSSVLTETGEVFTFGNGDSGKLGHGNENNQIFPKLVQDLVNIKSLSAGVSHLACLDREGSVFTCGAGYFGRLANGSNENLNKFLRIHSKGLRKYSSVSCGAYHTLLLDEDGLLFAAGKKELVFSKFDEHEPKVLNFFQDFKIFLICAAEEHSVVVANNGDAFAWGMNKYGKVGNGSESHHFNQPQKINLPSGLLMVKARLNHNLALISTGEIYVWGCGSAGRLGTGNFNNLKKPTLLQTRWTVLADKAGNKEEEANALDLILSQLETGVRLTSLKEVILVLQTEERESQISELVKSQDLLLDRFSEMLGNLEKCKKFEDSCTALVNEFEAMVLQRAFELRLPQMDYLKVFVPPYLAGKQAVLERMFWILQQQPCYLSKLVVVMQIRGARDLAGTISGVRRIFSSFGNSEKSREALLFLSLCKEVITSEIESVERIDEIFSSGICLTGQFLLTFFSRENGSDLFDRILLKPVSDTLEAIQVLGPSSFMLEGKGYSGSASRSNAASASKTKGKVNLEDCIVYLTRSTRPFIENFKGFPAVLPNSVKILIKHAYSRMVQKAWLKEGENVSLKDKMYEALLRLLINQLMIPAIVTPENEGLVKRQLDPDEREVFALLADLIKKTVKNSAYAGDKFSDLNEFIRVSHAGLVHAIETCIGVEDSLSVDLVVSIFCSHLSKSDSFIHFPVNDMIHVLVMLIKYRKSIELTGRDELFDLLDSISEIGSVVSNTLENFKMNIKLQNSFLVSGQVAVCSLCGVPMPAEIAVIGESKETIVKTIKIDNSGFVEILENAFRKIPAFASGSLEEVSENLRKLTEVMISGANPNYKLLFDLRQADERINDLIARNYSLDYVLFELSKRISERHHHRNYLQKLKEGVHFIEDAQSEYLEFLMNKKKDLETCIENVKLFKTCLNPTQKQMKDMAFFKLQKKHEQNLKNKDISELPPDVKHQIVGDVRVDVLQKYSVIERLAHGFKSNISRDLWLHFSNDRRFGWKFEVIYVKGKTKDMIGSFSLNNQEFIDIKRTANSEARLEVPGVGTFKLGPFVLFINSRIREQVV